MTVFNKKIDNELFLLRSKTVWDIAAIFNRKKFNLTLLDVSRFQ